MTLDIKAKAEKALSDAKGMRDVLRTHHEHPSYAVAMSEAENIIFVLQIYVDTLIAVERITEGGA